VPTKADIVQSIAERIGVDTPPMSSGSSEPKRIFEMIVQELGLAIQPGRMTKPDLAHAIVDAAELRWSPVTCESSGGTVTKAGLDLVRESVEVLMGS